MVQIGKVDQDSKSLNLEAKASHASFVLLDSGLAFLLGIFGLGEKHAVIAGGLLGLADAAGLKGRQG
jgi:hypothetical protein